MTTGKFSSKIVSIRAWFKGRINPSDMSPGQRMSEREKVSRVIDLKIPLYKARSVRRLEKLAKRHLGELFGPDRISVTKDKDLEFPGFNQLIEFSLRENRVIYVPDLRGERAIITGQVPLELHDVYSTQLLSLGINPSDLQNVVFNSFAVAPLVTGLDEVSPVEEYPRHGALIICSKKADMFDPHSDIKALRMYADYFALAFADKSNK